MTSDLSPRLAEVVEALPLRPGMRVLEIGCGPGAAARAVAARLAGGAVVAIDRSQRAIAQAERGLVQSGLADRLSFRCTSVEDFRLSDGEAPFDLAFAIRVGALDGRHPDAGRRALVALSAALRPGAPLYIDGGDPLRRIDLPGS